MDCFNPRPRTGSDTKWGCRLHRRAVSIQRPRTGSDEVHDAIDVERLCFNPRPRTGSDARMFSTTGGQPMFQSTPPHGERLVISSVTPLVIDVSIHAPARGATAPRLHVAGGCVVSIHAPARGATHVAGQRLDLGDVSIHAPARGATTFEDTDFWPEDVSIHAPARGATGFPSPRRSPRAVSIHAPARGATPPVAIVCR